MAQHVCPLRSKGRAVFYPQGGPCLRVHQVLHNVPTAMLGALEARGYDLKEIPADPCRERTSPSGWYFCRGLVFPHITGIRGIRTLQKRIWGRYGKCAGTFVSRCLSIDHRSVLSGQWITLLFKIGYLLEVRTVRCRPHPRGAV